MAIKSNETRYELQISENARKDFSKILSILSKPDTNVILLASVNGFEAGTDSYLKLGITRKQYNVRRKQLIDLGLIKKQGNHYKITIRGSAIFDGAENTFENYLKFYGEYGLYTEQEFQENIKKAKELLPFLNKEEKPTSVESS